MSKMTNPDKIPGKRREVTELWNDAKAYVLARLTEAGDDGIPSPQIAGELNLEFKFKNETAPWGIIKSLVDRNQVHYVIHPMYDGKKNVRVLYLGPQKGGYVQIKDVAKPEVKPVTVPDLPKPAPYVEPVEKKPIAFPAHKPEPKPEPEMPKEVAPVTVSEMPKETPKPVVPVSEDEAVLNEMANVAEATIKPLLARVDAELEKAISPRLKAQLRMAGAIAVEAKLLDAPISGETAMSQRDKLKQLLEATEAKK